MGASAEGILRSLGTSLDASQRQHVGASVGEHPVRLQSVDAQSHAMPLRDTAAIERGGAATGGSKADDDLSDEDAWLTTRA